MNVRFRPPCLLVGCALWGGCTAPRYRLPTVKLHSGSEIERRAGQRAS